MKKYFSLALFLLLARLSFSQLPNNCPAITFTYDASGNRIQRDLVIGPCNSEMPGPGRVASTIEATVYPNPTMDKINVELKQNDAESESKIELYDLNGKTVYSSVISGSQMQIDMSEFVPGNYLLKIIRGKEFITYPVLKN